MLAAVDWWQTLQVYDTRIVDIGTDVHSRELMIACVGHCVWFVYLESVVQLGKIGVRNAQVVINFYLLGNAT